MTGCAVVIVNYNAGPMLADAVLSACDASEIVVVDNASADDSLKTLPAKDASPRLRVIRNAENLGFAAACNIGVAATSAPAVLFLNPDCRLLPGALARLHDVLFAAPSTGMAGPLLLNPDGSEQRGGRRRIPTPSSGFVRGFGLHVLGPLLPARLRDFNEHCAALPDRPVAVEAISGGCMMVRRATIEAVGPWDEGYFLHVEDIDYCARLGRAGWTIMFVPDARVVHVQGVSSRDRRLFVEWHKHRGMVRFYRKFFSDNAVAPQRWLVTSGVWLRFGLVSGWISLRKFGRMFGSRDVH